MPPYRSPGVGGLFLATDQLNALVYGNSDVPPPEPLTFTNTSTGAAPEGQPVGYGSFDPAYTPEGSTYGYKPPPQTANDPYAQDVQQMPSGYGAAPPTAPPPAPAPSGMMTDQSDWARQDNQRVLQSQGWYDAPPPMPPGTWTPTDTMRPSAAPPPNGNWVGPFNMDDWGPRARDFLTAGLPAQSVSAEEEILGLDRNRPGGPGAASLRGDQYNRLLQQRTSPAMQRQRPGAAPPVAPSRIPLGVQGGSPQTLPSATRIGGYRGPGQGINLGQRMLGPRNLQQITGQRTAPTTKPNLSAAAQAELDAVAAQRAMTAAQRAQAAREQASQRATQGVQSSFRAARQVPGRYSAAPPTSPVQGGASAVVTPRGLTPRQAIGAGLGLAAGIGAIGEALDTPRYPTFRVRRSVPIAESFAGARAATPIPLAQWTLQPDGRVTPGVARDAWEREAPSGIIDPMTGTETPVPPVKVVRLQDDGTLLLTHPAFVSQAALAAAVARGEEPWTFADDAELDIALDAADVALTPEERTQLVGVALMIPKVMVDALRGASVTYTPIPGEQAVVVDTSISGGDGSSWVDGGYGGGGGYGYGYGAGSGGGWSAAPPVAPVAFMDGGDAWMARDDPWASPIFARHFATRNSGWPFRGRLRGRRGRIHVRPRGRSGRRSATVARPTRGVEAVAPVGVSLTVPVTRSDEALAAALALRDSQRSR